MSAEDEPALVEYFFPISIVIILPSRSSIAIKKPNRSLFETGDRYNWKTSTISCKMDEKEMKENQQKSRVGLYSTSTH